MRRFLTNPMVRFLAGRTASALVTLLIFVTITFFLINLLIPYDYATQFFFGGGVAAVEAKRTELGLDRPVVIRYLHYLGDLVRGGLGRSFGGEPVVESIAAALPTTLLIFAAGGILAFLLGDWLGRFVAWHRSRLVAGATTTASVLLYTAFPPWLVFLLIYFGTDHLHRLRSAMDLPYDSTSLWSQSVVSEADVLRLLGIGLLVALLVALVLRALARRRGWRLAGFLALPVTVGALVLAVQALGIGTQAVDVSLFRASRRFSIGYGSPALAMVAFVLLAFGEIMFVMRTGVAAEMNEDYVATARGKGIPERLIRDRHVGRNAILPALSRFFTSVPYVLTGLIIIERQLGVGGLSALFFNAVQSVDVPVILGILIVMGLIGLVLRLVLDILHAVLDPRIRLGGV